MAVTREENPERTLVDALAAQTGLDRGEIDPDSPLVALPGMESVRLLRAVVQLEEAHDVAIPDDVLFDRITARQLARLVTEMKDGMKDAMNGGAL